jgi:hypothetical protein
LVLVTVTACPEWTNTLVVIFCEFNVAVIVATMELAGFPEVTLNVAVAVPVGNATVDGTPRAGLLLVRPMLIADVVGWFRVIVHVVDEFAWSVASAQLNDVIRASVMVAAALWLPRVAVTVAAGVVEDVNVPVVAETVALLAPHSTVTFEGTVRAGLLLCSETRILDCAV